MLTSDDYEALAKTYGRVGGMDRIATLVKAIRAERGAERVLLLDGGDALQGSYTALKTKGGDMVAVLRELGVAATTGHWEFTLGARRVAELFGGVGGPGSSGLAFLAGNVRDTDFEEPVFHSTQPVRARRRRCRRHRPGLPLHAHRQPALDDAATGRSASARESCGARSPPRAGRARRWWCCCRTTASTSTASSRPASRASTSSCPPTPTMPCRSPCASATRC